MSEPEKRPDGVDIAMGVAIIFFGLCILLVGGGCTIFWVYMMANVPSGGSGGASGLGMLALSVAAAGVGLFAIVKGVQQFRGRG